MISEEIRWPSVGISDGRQWGFSWPPLWSFSWPPTDTDVVSRLQRADISTEVQALIDGSDVAISFVTVGELYKGAFKGRWGPKRIDAIRRWFALTVVLEYDAAVAETWGRLAAELEGKGRPTPVNDLWIAACCIAQDVPLLTFNRRDFAHIPGLQLLP